MPLFEWEIGPTIFLCFISGVGFCLIQTYFFEFLVEGGEMDGEGLGVRVTWEEGATLSEVGSSSSVDTGSPRAGGTARGKRISIANNTTTIMSHCRKYRNYYSLTTVRVNYIQTRNAKLNASICIRLYYPELMVARLV